MKLVEMASAVCVLRTAAVAVRLGVDVLVGDGSGVDVLVGVGTGVLVLVGMGVSVGRGVLVGTGVSVGRGVGTNVGVAGACTNEQALKIKTAMNIRLRLDRVFISSSPQKQTNSWQKGSIKTS